MPSGPGKAFGIDTSVLPAIRNAGISRDPARACFPLYTLSHDEINLIASGRVDARLNGATFPVRPGHAYLYVKGDVFGDYAYDPRGNALVCRWVKFDLPAGAVRPRTRFPRCVPLTAVAQRELNAVFDRMLDAWTRRGPGDTTQSAGCLVELLGLLQTETARWKAGPAGPSGPGEAADRKLAAGLAYMETRFAQRMKIGQVAEAAGLSEDYFERLFRKRIGRAPLQHLIRLRLEEGRRLLARMPGCKVEEAARKAGFDDPKYFTRMFRKAFGLSPREFRVTLSASWRQ